MTARPLKNLKIGINISKNRKWKRDKERKIDGGGVTDRG
jgi:hypothetical protein